MFEVTNWIQVKILYSLTWILSVDVCKMVLSIALIKVSNYGFHFIGQKHPVVLCLCIGKGESLPSSTPDIHKHRTAHTSSNLSSMLFIYHPKVLETILGQLKI